MLALGNAVFDGCALNKEAQVPAAKEKGVASLQRCPLMSFPAPLVSLPTSAQHRRWTNERQIIHLLCRGESFGTISLLISCS